MYRRTNKSGMPGAIIRWKNITRRLIRNNLIDVTDIKKKRVKETRTENIFAYFCSSVALLRGFHGHLENVRERAFVSRVTRTCVPCILFFFVPL